MSDLSPAKLSWKVENAKSVIIDKIGKVSLQSACNVVPRQNTTYVLKAIGFFGNSTTERIEIKVSKSAPKISFFEASTLRLNRPEPIKLSWNVFGAERIVIENLGDVSKKTEVLVQPNSDIRYTLRAISHFGIESNKTLIIKTSKAPPTIQFHSKRITSSKRKKVKIFWSVKSARHIEIDNGIGPVKPIGERILVVENESIITLKAISHFGIETSKKLTIKVIKKPKFEKDITSINSATSDKDNYRSSRREFKMESLRRNWKRK